MGAFSVAFDIEISKQDVCSPRPAQCPVRADFQRKVLCLPAQNDYQQRESYEVGFAEPSGVLKFLKLFLGKFLDGSRAGVLGLSQVT